jgi:hypothetical protein
VSAGIDSKKQQPINKQSRRKWRLCLRSFNSQDDQSSIFLFTMKKAIQKRHATPAIKNGAMGISS